MLRRHRAAHRAVWLALALALPGIVALGIYLRERTPGSEAPIRLEAPK